MTRPIPEWKHRAPVEPVTHEAQPSGLLGAYGRVSRPSVLEVVERAARITGGVVRLDGLAAEAMLSASYTALADLVRDIADALDTVRPVLVVLGGVTLVDITEGDDEPAAYRWPDSFTGWAQVKRGSVEDCTVLAALAVGVALWGRLPTADEVAAWMDEDEPRAAAVEVG